MCKILLQSDGIVIDKNYMYVGKIDSDGTKRNKIV